jgi:hypothetical protein
MNKQINIIIGIGSIMKPEEPRPEPNTSSLKRGTHEEAQSFLPNRSSVS